MMTSNVYFPDRQRIKYHELNTKIRYNDSNILIPRENTVKKHFRQGI